MSGSIIQAKNPSNQYVPLAVDSSGRLECSVNEIELTATQISLDVNDLETLQTAGNNTLSSIDNKVILPSALDGDRLKTIATGTVTVSGVSTEAKQDSIISTLGDTNNKIDAMRGSNSISDLATKLNAGLPSALSSDNLKVSIQEGQITGFATSANQTTANNTLSSIDNKIVLPSALDSGKLKVVDSAVVDVGNKIDAMRASDTLTTLKAVLDTIDADTGDIKTAVEILDNAISGNEMQVDVVASLPTGSNTIGKVNVGTFDSSINVADGGGSLTVDNSVLTSLNSAINSNRVDVNIANGGFGGAVTNAGTFAVQVNGDALTSLQLIDNIVKNEDTAHSGGDAGVQIFSVRKDTATSLASHDADYTPLITDANGRLHGINKTAKVFSSEVSYVSGQSISGSGGTFTGSSITLDANVEYLLLEHNFSSSDVSYQVETSIDGSNFFTTGAELNGSSGFVSATTTGINIINTGFGQSTGLSPFIRIKFTNGNASSQTISASYVIKSS